MQNTKSKRYRVRLFGGEYMSVRDFAERAGVTYKTGLKWAKAGLVDAKREGHNWYVHCSALEPIDDVTA